MKGKLGQWLDKPSIGLYLSPVPVVGQHYTASHPANLYQALRLLLAKKLIWLGYRLLLNNGETWIETS